MRIRKTLSLILALVMCLSLAVPAFAAEETVQPNTNAIIEIGDAATSPLSVYPLQPEYIKIEANSGYVEVFKKTGSAEYVITIQQDPSNKLPSNIALDVIMNGRDGMLYKCEDFLNGFENGRNLVFGPNARTVLIQLRGKTIFGNMNHDTYKILLPNYKT